MKTPIEQRLNQKIKEAAQKMKVGDVNRIRIIVALERLIARLQAHPNLSRKLIFGGGFVLFKVADTDRFTMDADAIISGINKTELDQEMRLALINDLEDGFWFGNIDSKELETESGYGGIRYRVSYKIGLPPKTDKELKQLPQVHVDISIGVSLEVPPVKRKLDSILDDFESVSWSIYPLEFIASEKIHALISREGASTRAKDIYDLSIILPKCKNKENLKKAIAATFRRRKDTLPASLHEEAKGYDTELVSNVWRKLNFSDKKPSFSECWNCLIEEFQRLN